MLQAGGSFSLRLWWSVAVAGTRASRSVLEKLDDSAFRAWTRRVTLAIGLVYLASGGLLLAR